VKKIVLERVVYCIKTLFLNSNNAVVSWTEIAYYDMVKFGDLYIRYLPRILENNVLHRLVVSNELFFQCGQPISAVYAAAIQTKRYDVLLTLLKDNFNINHLATFITAVRDNIHQPIFRAAICEVVAKAEEMPIHWFNQTRYDGIYFVKI